MTPSKFGGSIRRMIKLYQFPPNEKTRNYSPFCLKLETYLRLADIPYESVAEVIPAKAPKKKLPYIVDDGKPVADSGLIIEHLKQKYGNKLDARLSAAQRAQATAVTRMLEDNLYFALVYFRWIDEPGWSLARPALFGHLPAPLQWVVGRFAQKQVLGQLRGQGMGRHTRDEIYAIGAENLTALSHLLGDQNYFFGDKPATVDTVAYGFLKNLHSDGFGSPLTKHFQTLPNLVKFVERIDGSVWKDGMKAKKKSAALH